MSTISQRSSNEAGSRITETLCVILTTTGTSPVDLYIQLVALSPNRRSLPHSNSFQYIDSLLNFQAEVYVKINMVNKCVKFVRQDVKRKQHCST